METIYDDRGRYDSHERVMMREAGYRIVVPARETPISTHVDAARVAIRGTMKVTHRDGRITDEYGNPWEHCFPPVLSDRLPVIKLPHKPTP